MKISKTMKYLAAVPALAALVAGGFLAPAAQADDGVDSTTPPPETSLVLEGPVSIPPEVDATSVATDAVEVTSDPVVVEAPIEDTATQQVDTVADAVADPTQGAVTSEGSTEGTTPEVAAPGVVAPVAPVAEVLVEDPADLPIVVPTLLLNPEVPATGYTVAFKLIGGSNWNDGALYGRVKDSADEYYGFHVQKLTPGQTEVTITMPEIPAEFEFYVGVSLLANGENLGGGVSNYVYVTLPVVEPPVVEPPVVEPPVVEPPVVEPPVVEPPVVPVIPETPVTSDDSPKAGDSVVTVEQPEDVAETDVLAATGFDYTPGILWGGFALLLAGGAILVVRRVRRITAGRN